MSLFGAASTLNLIFYWFLDALSLLLFFSSVSIVAEEPPTRLMIRRHVIYLIYDILESQIELDARGAHRIPVGATETQSKFTESFSTVLLFWLLFN